MKKRLPLCCHSHGSQNFFDRLRQSKILVIGASYALQERERLSLLDSNYIGLGLGESDFVPDNPFNMDWTSSEFTSFVSDILGNKTFEAIVFDRSVHNCFTQSAQKTSWGIPTTWEIAPLMLPLLEDLIYRIEPDHTVYHETTFEDFGYKDTALQEFVHNFGRQTCAYDGDLPNIGTLSTATRHQNTQDFYERLGKATTLVIDAAYAANEQQQFERLDPHYIAIGSGETDQVLDNLLNEDWTTDSFHEFVEDLLPAQQFKSVVFNKPVCVTEDTRPFLDVLITKIHPDGVVYISGDDNSSLHTYFKTFDIKVKAYNNP